MKLIPFTEKDIFVEDFLGDLISKIVILLFFMERDYLERVLLQFLS